MKSFCLAAAVAFTAEEQALLNAEAGIDLTKKFEEFVQTHKREYKSTAEMLHRLKVFLVNMVEVAKKNISDKHATYSHLSPFADWSKQEFKARNNLKVSAKDLAAPRETVLLSKDGPASFDWREHGAVCAVKDQAQCGSCWAFSSVCNIESVNFVQGKNELVCLSEQELVSCSQSDNGCNGGLQPRAFDDLINNKMGLELESDYPYASSEGEVPACSVDQSLEKVFINSWKMISQDEDQIAAALVQYGVLAIALNANPFQMYSSGIMNPDDCDPDAIDHAVNLVGYSSDASAGAYWIIRNSWASTWGEQGYVRLVRGVGKCGMNTIVSTAVINPSMTDKIIV